MDMVHCLCGFSELHLSRVALHRQGLEDAREGGKEGGREGGRERKREGY